MAEKDPIRILAEVEIDEPAPGATVMLTDGRTISVEGRVPSGDIPRVRLFVHPPSEEPDLSGNDPNVPYVEGEVVDNHFAASSVGNARGSLAGNVVNRLTIWKYQDNQWQLDTTVDFLGQHAAEQTVTVSAKNCVMFAWAPEGYIGPEIKPELERESGDLYRPIRVQVPTNATSVVISAQGSWTHHPPLGGPETSGPNGRGRIEETRSAYQDAAYGSQNIPLPNTNLNRLIALRQPDPDTPGSIDLLGEAETFLDVDGDTKLFLGFHDGYHWANNEGEVTVTLRWS